MYKKYLTEEELENVSALADFDDEIIQKALNEDEDVSLGQLVNEDHKALMTVLKGYARSKCIPYTEILEKYIYNKKESEKDVQARLTAEIIREYRAKTGLSQKGFAKMLDMPTRSLENYESATRVPSKYVLKYIKLSIAETENISIQSEYCLPWEILSATAKEYIITQLIPKRAYRIVDQGTLGNENYVVSIDKEYENGSELLDNCPSDLKACAILGTEYGCTRLVFGDGFAVSIEDEKIIKHLTNSVLG